MIENQSLIKCLISHQESNMVGNVPELILCCIKCKPLKVELHDRLWIVEFLQSAKKSCNFVPVKKKVIYLDDEMQSPAVKARSLGLDRQAKDLGIGTLSYRRATKGETIWFLNQKIVKDIAIDVKKA